MKYFLTLDGKRIWNSNQQGFMPVDFCIHQLLWVTRKIYGSFDSNSCFLDVSEAFDWVLHEGLIYKKMNGCKWYLLTLIETLLSERQKSCSKWTRICIADNQSRCVSWFNSCFIFFIFFISIFFFLIYINYLSHNLEPNLKLFVDVTIIFSVVADPVTRQYFTKTKQWPW